MPGGGQSPDDWYYLLGPNRRNRPNYVWLSQSIDDAHGWKGWAGEKAHIDEVHPGDRPQPWNVDGTAGFVVPHATVKRKVASIPEGTRRQVVAMPAPEEAHDMPEAPFFDRPTKDNPGMKDLAPNSWFHARQHDIPEGSHLKPSGGASSYDSPESRQHKFYDTPSSSGQPFAKRRDWVWLENHPSFVEGWAGNDNKPNIYLVEPHDGPYPWNGTAQAGWVANGATVKKKISGDGKIPREYYDMYHDDLRRNQKRAKGPEQRPGENANRAWERWLRRARRLEQSRHGPAGP